MTITGDGEQLLEVVTEQLSINHGIAETALKGTLLTEVADRNRQLIEAQTATDEYIEKTPREIRQITERAITGILNPDNE
jgi:F0F1-type ATP synthase membrane subunit b/b'